MKDSDYSGKDKILHAAICCLLSLYSTEFAIGAALAKEFTDTTVEGNHWCWWDILADFIGIAFGTTVRMLTIGRYNWI